MAAWARLTPWTLRVRQSLPRTLPRGRSYTPSRALPEPNTKTSFRVSKENVEIGTPPTTTTTTTTVATPTSAARNAQRLDRIIQRLPRRLRGPTEALRSHPTSHVVSFLLLHELTAIVPLLAIFGLLQYWDVSIQLPVAREALATSSPGAVSSSPSTSVSVQDSPSASDSSLLNTFLERWSAEIQQGLSRFERYFTRKQWFGFGNDSSAHSASDPSPSSTTSNLPPSTSTVASHPEQRYQLLVHIALSWAITKALLPARILLSVWATPPVARLLGAATKFMTRAK